MGYFVQNGYVLWISVQLEEFLLWNNKFRWKAFAISKTNILRCRFHNAWWFYCSKFFHIMHFMYTCICAISGCTFKNPHKMYEGKKVLSLNHHMSRENNKKRDHIEQNKLRKMKWKQNAKGKCWIWNKPRENARKKYQQHRTRTLHKMNARMKKSEWVVYAVSLMF